MKLYNTLTRQKETLAPITAGHVKMYVCGPTVYAPPHIGNARSAVVYDVLFRVLKASFPQVTYVRNITDVDDKINAAALERGETIQSVTEEATKIFHDDMDALSCERPTIEPRATEHIAEIISMIEALIDNGNAYVTDGHVLFAVTSDKNYGKLSGRTLDEMRDGVRVEVAGYKKDAGDFVLWKPAAEKDDASSVFESPWGKGRPGWHIECSAMSTKHLGLNFDIHGGGADLMFPHHENEIAQSTCASPGSHYATMWVHNGFLTVNGEKMSKSLGNFFTVRELLEKGVKGEVMRLAFLLTHYRKPLDWSDKLIEDAQKILNRLYRAILPYPKENITLREDHVYTGVLDALQDDLNTSKAIALLQGLENGDTATLLATANLLGLLHESPSDWFQNVSDDEGQRIQTLVDARIVAKKTKNWAEADRIRNALKAEGITLEDKPDGSSTWRKG